MWYVQVNLCQKLFFLQNMGRTCCVQKMFWMSETISVHNMFSPGLSLEFSCIEPVIQWTNLSSYCGLVDAKIRASDKDLPVLEYVLLCLLSVNSYCNKLEAMAIYVIKQDCGNDMMASVYVALMWYLFF